jgi:APA family basic amino acid/polyamine antiporter
LAIIYVLSGTFDQILTFMGISLGIFPILTVFAVFKLRATGKSKYKISGYPFTQIIFLLFSVIILVTAYLNRPVESSLAFGVTLLGIPFYYLFLKRKRNLKD